jgi:hypothetical protein
MVQALNSFMEDSVLAWRLFGTMLLTVALYFNWQRFKKKTKGHALVGSWAFHSMFFYLIFAVSVDPSIAYYLGGFTAYIFTGMITHLIWYDRAINGQRWFSADKYTLACWPLPPFTFFWPNRWKERCLTLKFGWLLRTKHWLLTPSAKKTPFLAAPVGVVLLFITLLVVALIFGVRTGAKRAIEVDNHNEKIEKKIEVKADSLGREIKETRFAVDSAKIRADSAAARADTAKMQADSLKRQIKALQASQTKQETELQRKTRETQIEALKSRIRQLERRQSTSLIDIEALPSFLRNYLTQQDSLRRYHEENVYGRIPQQTEQTDYEEYDYEDDRP